MDDSYGMCVVRATQQCSHTGWWAYWLGAMQQVIGGIQAQLAALTSVATQQQQKQKQ